MKTQLASEYWDSRWREKLLRLIARKKKAQAIRLLDKLIESTLPLFRGDPRILHDRRIAWLFKIDLLRDWGRQSESLAWICLECELHPDNIAALALREKLKNELDLPTASLPAHEEIQPPASSSHPRWEGVAGMRELKSVFDHDIILPLQYPDLYARFKVPIPNGIILYGPPGCGKTFFVRAAAKNLGYHFIEVKPSDLASPYVHGTQKLIGEMFNKAEAEAPCLLFIDEIDAFVPNRGSRDVGHHYSSEVNEFLTQLNECSRRRILIVGATNRLENVDPAILRPGRMDKKILIPPPDFEARTEAVRIFMNGRPQSNIDWIRVSEYTEGHTFAEIEHIVNEAARRALRLGRDITTEDLIEAILVNPPAHGRLDQGSQ